MTFDAVKLYLAIAILVVWGVICGLGGWKASTVINGSELKETKLECTAKDLQAANDALAGEKAARAAEVEERAKEKKADEDMHKVANAAIADYNATNTALKNQLTAQRATIQRLSEDNAHVKAQLDTPYDPALVAGLLATKTQGGSGAGAPGSAAGDYRRKKGVRPTGPQAPTKVQSGNTADSGNGQPANDNQRLPAGH